MFYESDDISRVMPGKKDFVSVKKDGERQHVQKRLILSNLREVYHELKERFPDCKVGFSKFAQLRPKYCVLAGASGTHSVCVCTIHQNIKLMSFEMQIPRLPTYHHCLAKIMCNPPHARCYLGECDVYQLFTLGIVATKIMQRNGVVWSDAFNSRARSLAQENCTLLYQSPIAQWKSDTTQPQMHPGKRESL